MASKTELERVAAEGAALRPDWPVRSILTYLTAEHAHRAYRDLAVALAYIATDAATVTPKRLSESGPWWSTSKDAPAPIHFTRCPEPGHTSFPSHNCSACQAEQIGTDGPTLPGDTDPLRSTVYSRGRALVDAALDEART